MTRTIFLVLIVLGGLLAGAGMHVFAAGAYLLGVIMVTVAIVFDALVFSAWRESRRAVWK